MEVVCLILGPMLASRPCSHTFWVLTSLHLLSFLLKMFFIILVFIVFFSLNGVNMFVQCRLQKYWCKLHVYIMKSYNHKCIKACSSMKVSLLYTSIIYDYELVIILFHLQMMSIFYFSYSSVCSPTRSSVSHCVNNYAKYTKALILIIIIFRMYLLTNFITMLI